MLSVLQVSNDKCWSEIFNLIFFFLCQLSPAPLNLNGTTHPSNRRNVDIKRSAVCRAYLENDDRRRQQPDQHGTEGSMTIDGNETLTGWLTARRTSSLGETVERGKPGGSTSRFGQCQDINDEQHARRYRTDAFRFHSSPAE